MRTAEQTALLIALLFKRSEQCQARLNMDTVRSLSRRRHIRSAFVTMLAGYLEDLGLILMEIDGDGYGLLASNVLAGAPTVTAKKYLADDLDKLDHGEIDFHGICDELGREAPTDKSVQPRPWLRANYRSNDLVDGRRLR
jgi:hypothetical protein